MENLKTFSISIRGDLITRLPEIKDGNTLVRRLAQAMDRENLLTVSHIQRDYLSFPGTGPTTLDGLRYITGRYRDSLRAAKTELSGASLESGIGTNVVSKDGVSYPLVHETGAEIPPHDIRARNGKALRFFDKSGNAVFRKVVHFPGATIPARRPIQRGIEDRLSDYSKSFNQVIEQLLTKN